MKKILCVMLLLAVCAAFLSACGGALSPNITTAQQTTAATTSQATAADSDVTAPPPASAGGAPADPPPLGDTFSPAAFFEITESAPPLSQEALHAVIASIPADRYEAYPAVHRAPFSATLYRDGESVAIADDDPRLIALINFFNNCVYYSRCSYTQGLLSADYLAEHVEGAAFRLELTYTPYGDEGPSPYGKCTTACDTIIITDSPGGVFLLAHDLPGYEGQEDYPFRAVGYFPLYEGSYAWLSLFGFRAAS